MQPQDAAGEATDDHAEDHALRNLRRLCEMTEEMFARMTPAQRDRLQQAHLAAARGPLRNLQLAAEMTDLLLALRRQAGVS